MSLWGRILATVNYFREYGITSDPLDDRDFASWESRQNRYDIYWAFYEGNAYRGIHSWAQTYKTQYGLYKYIRSIYNPSYRLGEFWKAHLMGGQLDPEAQDEGALPIKTEIEALRPHIAQLWKWSNWQINKDIFTLHGALFGDIALQVVDDVEKGKVYLQVVHPGTIKEIEKDEYGNVKSYTIEETRDDPTRKPATNRLTQTWTALQKQVTYTEIAERAGDNVVYKTLLDGKPYDWTGAGVEWEEPYGFIPMVIVQHNNVGLEWGWSELHPARGKIHEADDLASKLHDQIRKEVDPTWLFIGMKKPTTNPQVTNTAATAGSPQAGRQELSSLYAENENAKAQALVSNVDIPSVSAEIKAQLAEIERDYPELKVDLLRATGDVSGRALRIAQRPAEDKVNQRRAAYDDALVRAQQMAMAIGGMRGLFPGLGLNSYANGDLDHSIGERPVFAEDPLDGVEIDRAFWEAAGLAINAGIPLGAYLEEAGWTEEKIARLDARIGNGKVQIAVPGIAEGVDTTQPPATTDAALPSSLESDKGLNGAQITAAIEVLGQLAAGTMPEGVAAELLISMGIDEQRGRQMAREMAAKGKPTTPEQVKLSKGEVDEPVNPFQVQPPNPPPNTDTPTVAPPAGAPQPTDERNVNDNVEQ